MTQLSWSSLSDNQSLLSNVRGSLNTRIQIDNLENNNIDNTQLLEDALNLLKFKREKELNINENIETPINTLNIENIADFIHNMKNLKQEREKLNIEIINIVKEHNKINDISTIIIDNIKKLKPVNSSIINNELLNINSTFWWNKSNSNNNLDIDINKSNLINNNDRNNQHTSKINEIISNINKITYDCYDYDILLSMENKLKNIDSMLLIYTEFIKNSKEIIEPIITEENNIKCKICLEKNVNIVINPCGHTICEECFNKIILPKRCPTCRTENITSMKLYL